MTLYEIRIVTVIGLLALGVIAVLASLAMVHLQGFARRLNTRIARVPTLPSLRGDAREVARVIDHRQATWRLRC